MHPKSILLAMLLATGVSSVFAQVPFAESPAPYSPPFTLGANETQAPQQAHVVDARSATMPPQGNTSGQSAIDGASPPARSAYPTLTPSTETPAENDEAVDRDSSPLGTLLTVVSSLAIVLGLFFVLVWFLRRAAPRGQAILPTEVVEILGRAPLAGRQQMHLLRVGAKLVLISVTPDGTKPITEITDPSEVTRLAGLCQQSAIGSVSQTFRQVLGDFAREKSTPGAPRGTSATEQPHA